jgi:hypothetical protein
MLRLVMAVLVAACIVAIAGAAPAHACSFEPGPSFAFRRYTAPVGGVWWVGGIDTRFVDDVLLLVDDAGNEVAAPIVSMGAQGTAAVRVPDVAVGTRFSLEASNIFDNEVFALGLEPA